MFRDRRAGLTTGEGHAGRRLGQAEFWLGDARSAWAVGLRSPPSGGKKRGGASAKASETLGRRADSGAPLAIDERILVSTFSPARLYALGVGGVLVVAGIVGFLYNGSFSVDPVERDAVFGILEVNGWHNVVHLATGGLGLALAGVAARAYALTLGAVYTLVFVFGLIVGDGGNLLGLIPINTEDNVLHLLLGLLGLAAGLLSPRVGARQPARA